MRRVLALTLLLATPALAQDGPSFLDRLLGTDEASSDAEQGTLLEQLIEDSLSGAGRVVSVNGFRGALSGSATLAELTIADDEGVWLTLTDATLDWNRAALFAGRLDVTTLTAAQIQLPRLPVGDPAPTPEATGFQIPDLPVSVEIGQLAAERVELGEPVLGLAATISVDGALSLGDGNGRADIDVIRRDAEGQISLDASFDNTTERLGLDLSMQEAQGGILATLAGLPGAPAVDFSLTGDAPLSDFQADIRLGTDGTQRLSGRVTLSETENARAINADIAGDIAPIFAPAYQDFFGDRIALQTRALLHPDGRIDLPTFSLQAQEIALQGALELGVDRLPRKIDISGRIESQDGTNVLLPLTGEETRVGNADLTIAFDSEQSENWTASLQAKAVSRGSFAAEELALNGTGRIRTGQAQDITADFAFSATGADTGPALTEALGQTLSGNMAIDWQGGPVNIPRFALAAKDLRATGRATITQGFVAEGEVNLAAERLQNFSTIAGRQLTGQTAVQSDFTVTPLSGSFNVSVDGTTTNLTVDEPRADAVLQGTATLDLTAARDQSGLRLNLTRLESGNARVTGTLNLRSGGSTASLQANLNDAALVLPGLSGDADLRLTGLETPDRDWTVSSQLTAPGLSATVNGDVSDIYDTPTFLGRVTANSNDLSVFSDLAGRPLGGALAFDATAGANLDLTRLLINGTADGRNLSIAQAEADRLLAGTSSLQIEGSRSGDRINIAALTFNSPALAVETSGTLANSGDELTVQARLTDIAPFAAGLSGPLSVNGTIGRNDRTLALDLDATGPGSSRATVNGTMADNASTANLRILGSAPLALANRFIAPRSLAGSAQFDLSLDGPPALNALSGTISTNDARLSAPTIGTALNTISGQVALRNGQAEIGLGANVERGGRLNTRGSVGLGSPNQADLAINLTQVRLTDPRLYETTASGQVQITGPLAGGATIGGTLNLGETNIRIPNSTIGGAGEIPQIVHINEPPPVRGTRRKAGLLATSSANGGPRRAFPLDLVINAPNRVFVRGRGLESEFGGRLRLTGTTAEIAPLGAFELIRGRLDILGRRLALEEARITMQGALIPFLDIRASTQVDDTAINVEVFGPADNPEIRFTSNPELPQEEVLSRLLFGRSLSTLSPLQAARLALAVRTLAGQGGEGLVGRIRGQTGLADLDVTTDEDGNTAVRAGAYLGENLYSDVTVDSAGETQLNLNLDVSPSLTVRGGVTNEGETSLGIFFERDY